MKRDIKFIQMALIVLMAIEIFQMTLTGAHFKTLTAQMKEINSSIPEPIVIVTKENESKCYEITDEERAFVECVVQSEAGGEDLIGQTLVAQCILNSCVQENKRPTQVCLEKGYADPARTASDSVTEAVSLVFDDGYKYIDENIQYFYAPARTNSTWHENQQFVVEYGNHRFFK